MDTINLANLNLNEGSSDPAVLKLIQVIEKLALEVHASNDTIKTQATKIESFKNHNAELAEKYRVYKERAVKYRNKCHELKRDMHCAERLIYEMATNPTLLQDSSESDGPVSDDRACGYPGPRKFRGGWFHGERGAS